MALHPVGPLPAATYWWRRAVVVGIPLAVLLLLRSCTAGSPAQPRAAAPAVTPSASTAPTPAPSATPTATTIGTCADGVLKVSTTPVTASVPAGATVLLRLVVTNASLTPCTRDLGGRPVEVLVTRGRSRVWSSDDCGSTTGSTLVLLAPGASRTIEVPWTGDGSRPGCRGTGGTVPPGRYALTGRVGTLRAAGGGITLT